jgi:AcrR family transcriptional regulator
MDDDDAPVDRSRHVKQSIRDAAAVLFAAQGYGATGIRDIATQAGVDPALVIRHFGSKEGLFLRTMQVRGEFGAVVSGPIDGLGRRMVTFLLSDQADATLRGVYVALLRASDRLEVQEQLRESLNRNVIEPIAGRLDHPDAEIRARLFAAQMGGLMSALWVTSDTSLRDADPALLVDVYGALLQEAITPATPGRQA